MKAKGKREIGLDREERIKRRRKEIKSKKNEREGRRRESVLLGGAAMFCSPGVFSRLPHHGDLDLEECAPCSVSGKGGGGDSSVSLTHISIPPTRFSLVSFAVSASPETN